MAESTWQDELTTRLRTLLRTAPLHRLEDNKTMRSEALDAHDLRALSLRAIDAIIEAMGMREGGSLSEVRAALAPLIRSAEPGADDERVERLVELILDGLLNERDRRRAFSESYASIEADQLVHRVLSFHLVREIEGPEGDVLLQATTEGINLYAGMLAYDVEDAQTAEEAVLGAQLRRGRLAEAVSTARRARMRSVEYEQKLNQILQSTRRDVRQVDWVGDVLAMLTQAREHIEDRLSSEHEIRRAIERRLHAASSEDAGQLVTLSDVLADCIERHQRLHRKIISANQRYLDEQERQAFRPQVLTPLPDLEADLLRAALSAPMGTFADHAGDLLRWFHAPNPPRLFDLAAVIDRLLSPRRNTREDALPAAELELESVTATGRRFSDEEQAQVETLLARVQAIRLSELLLLARQQELSPAAQHLLVLTVLQGFDPSDESATHRVRPTGRLLRDLVFLGDDLMIERRERR